MDEAAGGTLTGVTKILLLLLQATWRYLAVVLGLLLAVAFLDLGRDAWAEAQRRQEALAALEAEEAAARAEAEQVDGELEAKRTARAALEQSLRAAAEGPVLDQLSGVRDTLATAQIEADRALRKERQLEDRLLGAVGRAKGHAETRARKACADGGAVQCAVAQTELYLAKRSFERARSAGAAQLRAAKEGAARAKALVARAGRDKTALEQTLLDPLDEGQRQQLRAADGEVASLEARRSGLDGHAARAAAEREELLATQGPADRLLATWQERRWQLLGAALFILLLPFGIRTLWYFALMPLVERGSAVRLLDPAREGVAEVEPSAAEVALVVEPGDELRARSSFVSRREGTPDTEWVYGGWSHPLTSILAGLTGLDRFRPTEGAWRVNLGDDDPDRQLLVLRLRDHPGFVLHPAHVVAIAGRPRLTRRWRWGLHAWLTFQFRYLLFEGDGTVVLSGQGHLQGEPGGQTGAGIASARVLGFDGRLAYQTSRTRPFFPYLTGRRPLIEDTFAGGQLFVWGKVDPAGARKEPLQRLLAAVFGALEKALGIG